MTFTPVTGNRKKAVETVETAGNNGKESKGKYPENFIQVACIWYLITFRKKSVPVLAFFGSSSKVNTIHPTFAQELELLIRPSDIEVSKIDGTMLDIFGIVVAAFSVIDKTNWIKFFKETFLLANVSLDVVLEMFFLLLSSADVDFLGQELR